MTGTVKDGGQAFPRSEFDGVEGMTLRDWFAGQWVCAGHHSNLRPHDAADQAYEFADSMLAARK